MNSIGKIAVLSYLLVLASCSRDREVIVPEDILSRDEMVAIMTDMHIVEGARMGRNMMGDSLGVEVYFEKIYAKHKVSKEEFDSSFSFYTKHPGTMDKIYEQVIENLNSLEVAAPRWENEDNADQSAEKADSLISTPPPGS